MWMLSLWQTVSPAAYRGLLPRISRQYRFFHPRLRNDRSKGMQNKGSAPSVILNIWKTPFLALL